MNRPLSVVIICGILIAFAVLGLVGTLLGMQSPEVREALEEAPLPVDVQYILTFAGLGIWLVSAVGMLKAKNWARMLYVIWTGLSFGLGLLTSPAPGTMLPGLLVYGIFVFFLFRPAANQFFHGSSSRDRPFQDQLESE